jgi:NSS family neurotransmitter:Na+ symporter
VFLFVTLFIVARGLQGGIEKAVKFLMPSLFVMLLVMIGYGAIAGDLGAGLRFLFSTDFSKIDGPVILSAIGQSFFSIGVAMGLMMVYGSYVPKNVSLTRASLIIAVADTLVAILAGLMIFPIVFANGLDPASGPGLIFQTLPAAFAAMPGGSLFGALFFLLLAFAAVTSSISIIEPIVAYGRDRWGMSRLKACTVFGVLAWLIGMQLDRVRIVEYGAGRVVNDLDIDQAGILRLDLGDQADFVVVEADQAAHRVGPERLDKVCNIIRVQ